MSFKSLLIMSCQFCRGLPGFLFMLLRFQFKAWFGIVQSSIFITCPSLLSLLSLIISFSFATHVLFLTSTLLTVIPLYSQQWSLKFMVCCFQCLHMFDCKWPQFCTAQHSNENRRSLRSARTNRLLVPSVKLSTVGGRAFPVADGRQFHGRLCQPSVRV